MCCTENNVRKRNRCDMRFVRLLTLAECTLQSIWMITSSSLSSPCLLKPPSGCKNTWTPPSSVSQCDLCLSWCELEHSDPLWSSLWQGHSPFWWVETTPSSGILFTMAVRFLGSWADTRKKVEKIRYTIQLLQLNHLPYSQKKQAWFLIWSTKCCQPHWFWGGNLLDEGHTVLNWFAEADTARLFSHGASLVGDTSWENSQEVCYLHAYIPIRIR